MEIRKRRRILRLKSLIAIIICIIVAFQCSACLSRSRNAIVFQNESQILPLDPANVSIDSETGITFVSDQLIVSFSLDTDRKSAEDILAGFEGEIVGSIADLNIFQVQINQEVTLDDLLQIATDLGENPQIEAVTLNTVLSVSSATEPVGC